MNDVTTRAMRERLNDAAPAVTKAEALPEYVGSRHFWTTKENQFLQDHYEVEGPAYCVEHLPRHRKGAIYQHATTLGLKAPKVPRRP